MNRPSDEIVERMVTLVGRMASTTFGALDPIYKEAHAIAAALKPVDPDVLAAREWFRKGRAGDYRQASVDSGACDYEPLLLAYLAGIRHARDGGWIEWHGGDCPVPAGARVLLKLRDGTVYDWPRPENSRWYHDSTAGDIVAYRVVK